jgi:phosphoglycolate phosphatase-like HAD superfamily hydrolase
MLLDASKDLGIDPGSSWMIGDSESDIAAGIAAGCRTALVAPSGTSSRAEIVAETLADAWRRISLLSLSNRPQP